MEKPLFPEWSPKDLIETFNRMKTEKEYSRRMYAEMDKDELEESNFGNWKVQVAEKDKLADLLFRLLTEDNMKPVWSTLVSQPPLDSNRLRTEPAFSLWSSITTALEHFKIFISLQQTTAQKSKKLKSISSQSKTLLKIISKDPFAAEIAKKVVAYYLSKKNIEWRENEGEIPPWYEYQVPMTLSSDCDEAWTKVRNDLLDYDAANLDNYHWHKRPLLARLRDWTQEAEKLDLVDLLQFFINWVDHEAQRPIEIKHPGRGESALRPFLIRRMNAHMQWYYGQPLDDAVAQIVTTILELNTPLTRDDVRPYITDSGKI